MLISLLAVPSMALLFFVGPALASALLLLSPPYIEYVLHARSLAVGFSRVFIHDRFTNVCSTFCVLHPVPILCSFGDARNARPYEDPQAETSFNPYSSPSTPPVEGPPVCSNLADTLTGQRVFYDQLSYAVVPKERLLIFAASSTLSSAAARFLRDAIPFSEAREHDVYGETAATVDEVDGALSIARRSLNKVSFEMRYNILRYASFVSTISPVPDSYYTSARFAQQVVLAALKIADFLDEVSHALPFVIGMKDATLRRSILYLESVTTASANSIATDVDNALEALNVLLSVYTSLSERRHAFDECVIASSSSSPVCLAMVMLLHATSTVEAVRDDLLFLKQTVEDGLVDLRSSSCTPTTQGCPIRVAIQLVVHARLPVEWDVLRVGSHARPRSADQI